MDFWIRSLVILLGISVPDVMLTAASNAEFTLTVHMNEWYASEI